MFEAATAGSGAIPVHARCRHRSAATNGAEGAPFCERADATLIAAERALFYRHGVC